MKTNELEKIEPKKVTLMIHGKEREIKFGFSAWGKLEEEFGGVKNLDKLQKKIENEPFKTIPHLLFLALKDKSAFTDSEGNKYPEVTEENILDDYGLGDVQYISEKFTEALYSSLPQDESGKKVKKEA